MKPFYNNVISDLAKNDFNGQIYDSRWNSCKNLFNRRITIFVQNIKIYESPYSWIPLRKGRFSVIG
jgi:hypothetical protein